jgi:PIN domain nuclease of toxin-antitoxin system
MKILLDTCAFLWLVTDDPQASPLAKEIFLNEENELLLSADQQLSAYPIERLW